MNSPRYMIKVNDWKETSAQVGPIRQAVFIDEQHVPPELEWDDMDDRARHAVAQLNNGPIIGCGRLTAFGQIGRMAVVRKYRNRGIGSAILLALEEDARQRGHDSVFIHAQTRALSFYKRHDYHPQGGEFDEANIPHRKCIKYL